MQDRAAATTGEVPSRARADLPLALLTAAVSVAAVLGTSAYLRQAEGIGFTAPQQVAAAGIVVLQSLVLVARRLRPTACLALVAALQVGLVAALPGGVGIQGLAFLVAAYTVGSLLPIRRALLSVVAIALLETLSVALVSLVLVDVEPAGGLSAVLGYGLGALLDYLAPALLGAFVATRRAYAEMVAARAEEEVAAERARADRAVRDERARMAREVHDVAAHHLSGMVVQAGAVERLIDTDPVAAKAATRELRLQGKQTLASLRTAVGILREPASAAGGGVLDDGGGPVPGVAGLAGLVETAARDGDVSLETTGEAWDLAPIADVTAYRVVQEALSNARQHAVGAPVRVRLAWQAYAVSVQVDNEAPGARVSEPPSPATPHTDRARQGLGLLGMRERAELVGAQLRAGPTPSGGWRVHLELLRAPGAPAEVDRPPEAPAEVDRTPRASAGVER